MSRLYCEIGDHYWERKAQRGRPPRNCPAHAPEKPVVHTRPKLQETSEGKIVGFAQAHEYEFSSDLQTALEAAEAEQRMETLRCELGDHDWQRERQRGKKPANCPEHRPNAISAPPSNKTTDHQAKVIEQILEAPRASQCRCGLKPKSTPAEIHALEGGCTTSAWRIQQYRDKGIELSPVEMLALGTGYVCPVLDKVRRALNL